MRQVSSRSLRALVLSLIVTASCDCGGERERQARDGGTRDGDVDASECRADDVRCEGSIAIECGLGAPRIDCASKGQSCIDGLGCSECRPGESSCANGMATFCRDDGTLARYECDPEQGLTCTPTGCSGECDLSQVYQSYIGCDYYPTVTLNPVWSGFEFAVAVSNTSAQAANVLITRGATVVQRAMVPAKQLATFTLPWVAELKGGDITCTEPPSAGGTRVVQDGAYRVRSDRPVTVYQFSPLEYAKPSPAPAACPTTKPLCPQSVVEQCFSYSNDASLLLPATTLTGNYTALAWPSQSDGAGFIAITATEDATRVDVTGAGGVVAGAGIGANGSGTVTLDRGDVLELVAAAGQDPSGSRVRASKPVQVISGHSCAYVPNEGVQSCDHLEEVVFPEDTLGKEYFVTYPVYSDGTSPTPYVVRVAATNDDTHVSFDPKVREDATLKAGEFLELAFSSAGTPPTNLHVRADKSLLVATYMVGQSALPFGFNAGDPSLSVSVPLAQYRRDYLFTAPVTYDVNLATIVAKRGTSVQVDGRALAASEFTPIGASEYGAANVMLDAQPTTGGAHRVSASDAVGLTVYGYGQHTSYMYPGGANLERISTPPFYF